MTEKMFGPRSEIYEWPAQREGNGSSRLWSREINGTPYSFTAVLMPNGERRYVVSKFNGYVGGPKFACAWDQIHFITIKPGE